MFNKSNYQSKTPIIATRTCDSTINENARTFLDASSEVCLEVNTETVNYIFFFCKTQEKIMVHKDS
jgi:hypothetical protein